MFCELLFFYVKGKSENRKRNRMSDKVKILVFTTTGFLKREGISTVIFDYFSRFDKELFDVSIAVDGKYSEELIEEFERAGISAKVLPSRKKSLKEYLKSLIKLVKKEKYDVIYTNGSSALMSIELMVAKLCGCKTRVVHSHNTTCDYKKMDKFLRPLFYRLYTDAFACGDMAGKWLYGSRNFKVIKNGRDIDKYRFDAEKRKKIRKELGVSDDCLLVGHVGNYNSKKNHQYILRVFKELQVTNSNSRLYLMGTGKLFDDMKQLSNELELGDNVVFMGSISNVEEMLQAMDVMIFPSIHEGLPLSVVEWQIASLPCLVSDRVTDEVAFSDLVHFMPLEKSYKEWAEALIRISDVDRQSRSQKNIELARENGFDIKANVEDLEKYFLDREKYK